MAKYLKKFENHTAYEASSLILPNVSICVQENDVHYNPSSPTPQYVDLGLPSGTLWAKWNVGATSETEYGNYYKYGKGSAQYPATSGESNYSGTENPLAASADTAAQEWGGDWHMPTSAQCAELTANTTYEWTTIDGVNGGKFTAQNGNYIFIPAAGYCYNGILDYVGSSGFVWSSTPYRDGNNSYYLFFTTNGYKKVDRFSRKDGFSVRPVIG